MIDENGEQESNLDTGEQVANIFQRASSGEPFGTKQDVNVLIDKICDHIYRKLTDENWCPCDRHSNTKVAEGSESIYCDVHESVTEGYMQRIRRKVLEILSEYLTTFKNQLFAKYCLEPTDPLNLNEEETDPVGGDTISGDPSSYRMASAQSFSNKLQKSQTAGLQSVTNTNVCDNSLSNISIDDWVSVSHCLSRENYFDQSPRVSVSASPAISRWSSDPKADGSSFGASHKPDRKTQSCTATPREALRNRDTRRRSPGDERVTSGDKLTPRDTFKKTNNQKLIKKSRGSMEKCRQQITAPPLLTETNDYHPDHFRHDTKPAIDRDIDGVEAGAANGDSQNGTSSLQGYDVPTSIGGVPMRLYGKRESVDYNYRRRSRAVTENRPTSMVRMRSKARNVVQFLRQLRKPVHV